MITKAIAKEQLSETCWVNGRPKHHSQKNLLGEISSQNQLLKISCWKTSLPYQHADCCQQCHALQGTKPQVSILWSIRDYVLSAAHHWSPGSHIPVQHCHAVAYSLQKPWCVWRTPWGYQDWPPASPPWTHWRWGLRSTASSNNRPTEPACQVSTQTAVVHLIGGCVTEHLLHSLSFHKKSNICLAQIN